jgi:hypothetical protein
MLIRSTARSDGGVNTSSKECGGTFELSDVGRSGTKGILVREV